MEDLLLLLLLLVVVVVVVVGGGDTTIQLSRFSGADYLQFVSHN
jgi:sensor domain CHASE-containing protein